VPADQYLKQAQAQIETALPGLRAIPAAERATNNQLVDAAHAAAWGTSLIALLIGILGIANTMAMSVFERTREIGILRAIGWSRWSILLLIEFEASVLGLAGGILGIGIGFGALRILSRLPQTASIVTSSIAPSLLVEAVLIAVFAGLLAGAVPAWRGAKLSPVEALRHE
jgi:putative ABC transport system permease protein